MMLASRVAKARTKTAANSAGVPTPAPRPRAAPDQKGLRNPLTPALLAQRVISHAAMPENSAPLAASFERAPSPSGPVLARQPANESRPVDLGTAQAEREREVEAIEVGGTSYVLYQTKVRGGGSSAWLANNPGNLDYTDDTIAWGCYEGKALHWGKHRFAIFQSESLGLAAVRKFLRKYQTIRDITQMMNLFAPAGDLENDPTKYSQRVVKRIGPPVTVHTLVRDLTDAQIELFAEAIKDTEGWTPGPVNDVPRGDPSLPEAVRKR
jgi:hypothetical protein